jgi:hypothetical protein
MSTRVIASIGVVLCAAMTSFSIYLGVLERVYTPRSQVTPSVLAPNARHLICEQIQPAHNTTTTNATAAAGYVHCLVPS